MPFPHDSDSTRAAAFSLAHEAEVARGTAGTPEIKMIPVGTTIYMKGDGKPYLLGVSVYAYPEVEEKDLTPENEHG